MSDTCSAAAAAWCWWRGRLPLPSCDAAALPTRCTRVRCAAHFSHAFLPFAATYTRSDPEPYDWYQRYASLKELLGQNVRKSDTVLVTGCGNSRLSEEMYDDGFSSITNVDYSPPVIDLMRAKHADKKGMSWHVMDVISHINFPDNSFDAVLDKGTLDCVLCGPSSTASAASYCSEVGAPWGVEGGCGSGLRTETEGQGVPRCTPILMCLPYCPALDARSFFSHAHHWFMFTSYLLLVVPSLPSPLAGLSSPQARRHLYRGVVWVAREPAAVPRQGGVQVACGSAHYP